VKPEDTSFRFNEYFYVTARHTETLALPDINLGSAKGATAGLRPSLRQSETHFRPIAN
jgi:hypothetical protein